MKLVQTGIISTLAIPLLLISCATVPNGPSVMALPGTGKSFDQFRADDTECRQYAQSQTGDADKAAVDSEVRSAALGTVLGAIAGAAVGGHQGAGSGAGTGLVMGTMIGTGTAQSSAHGIQRRYDNAYVQCMYAKGEQVPLPGSMTHQQQTTPATNAGLPPPPPPGNLPRQ